MLYDLCQDPQESRNLATTEHGKRLAERLYTEVLEVIKDAVRVVLWCVVVWCAYGVVVVVVRGEGEESVGRSVGRRGFVFLPDLIPSSHAHTQTNSPSNTRATPWSASPRKATSSSRANG